MNLARFLQLSLLLLSGLCSPACLAQLTGLFPSSQAKAVRPLLGQSSMNQLESLINSSEYEDLGSFSTNSRYRQHGSPIGRFKIFTAEGRFASCTAWLIAPDRVMTNHHCIDEKSFKIAKAVLELGVLSDAKIFDSYDINLPPVEANETLDYAILRVNRSAAQKYGHFSISTRDPVNSEELYIIHHPMGQPQVLSRYRCRAANPTIDGINIHHLCNTQPGSSGSPILSDNDDRLVGLHHAGSPLTIDPSHRKNQGILLSTIIAQSVEMKRILQARRGNQTPSAGGGAEPGSSATKVAAQDAVSATAPSPVNANYLYIEICPVTAESPLRYAISTDFKQTSGWHDGSTCGAFYAKSPQIALFTIGNFGSEWNAHPYSWSQFPESGKTGKKRMLVCAEKSYHDNNFGTELQGLKNFGAQEVCPTNSSGTAQYDVISVTREPQIVRTVFSVRIKD